MYEKFHQPVLPLPLFIFRVAKSILFGASLIALALGAGMWGYYFYEQMSWVDAFVNASMILSGMGPVSQLATTGGKVFAGFYALFSGLFFILILGILLSPFMHRFFHELHQALSTKAKK